MRHFTEADTADAKFAQHGARATADITTGVGAYLVLRLLSRLFNETLFCQKVFLQKLYRGWLPCHEERVLLSPCQELCGLLFTRFALLLVVRDNFQQGAEFTRDKVLLLHAERNSQRFQEDTSLFIGAGGSHHNNVHTAHFIDFIVVYLREDYLLFHTHREVSAPIK